MFIFSNLQVYLAFFIYLAQGDDEQIDVATLKLPEVFPCTYNGNINVTKRIIINCDENSLALMSVSFQGLEGFPLSQIKISHGRFERLYGDLFHKLTLEELDFEETHIITIDAGVFFGVNESLLSLSFEGSSFNQFPSLGLQPLGKLRNLVINGGNIVELKTSDLSNSAWTATLEKFRLINVNLNDIEAGSFMNFKKLKVLDLHNNNLTVLKKNQFKGLRETEVVDLSFNKLKKIDTSHLGDFTKLTTFNASHNELTEISRGAFAKNSVLRELNLSFNLIKRLDSHSFRGMRFLRRLYLSDNIISDVNRGTFANIRRIGTIDIARNLITKIDFEMFAQLNYIEVIDVAENKITQIQKQAFKELYLTHVNISHNLIDTVEVGSFENCVNMTILDLSWNKITELKKGVFDEISYAGVLDLSFNHLTNFSGIPLEHMLGLRILNVSYNNVTTIPKQTILKLYELNTIDASHNNISEIADNIFQPALSLRFLNLSFNALEKLKISTFGAVTTLLELDLSHNQLSKIPKETFIKLVSLRYLTLEHNLMDKMIQPPLALGSLNYRSNRLSSIDRSVWPVMNALLSLDLTDNQLGDNLDDENFSGLLTLRELFLSSNGITKISKGKFVGLNTLQYLGLENNNITEIEEDALGKMSIFVLNLYNNKIKNISDQAFMSLTTLSTLNLSSNAISVLPSDGFKGLLSLRSIDLSHNSIEKLDNKTNSVFEYCLNLEEVNLRGNRISFLSRKSFPYNQYFAYKIQKIDLSQNIMPIMTRDITIGSQNLRFLNMSHNAFQEIRPGVLSNMTSLRVLDVSFNKLRNLTFEEPLPNLNEFYLAHNDIADISWDSFVELKNLTHLDMSFNNLSYVDNNIVMNIKSGLEFKFKDNPIVCDCTLRPFSEIIRENKYKFDMKDVACHQPLSLSSRLLGSIDAEQLTCEEETLNELYPLPSDIMWRGVRFTRDFLWLSWFVQGSDDIADFYLSIKDRDIRKTIEEYHLHYNKRVFNISANALQKHDNLEVCLFAKDSRGTIKKYFKNQCFNLNSSWKDINRKCKTNLKRFCDIYDPKTKQFSDVTTSGSNSFEKNMAKWIIGLLVILIHQVIL